MEYVLEVKEEAFADIQDAYDYYEEQKEGLGERFLDNLYDYLDRVTKDPLHFQVRRKPYREAFIKIFPFLNRIIVYSIFNISSDIKEDEEKIKVENEGSGDIWSLYLCLIFLNAGPIALFNISSLNYTSHLPLRYILETEKTKMPHFDLSMLLVRLCSILHFHF